MFGKITASLNERLKNVEWGEYNYNDFFETKVISKKLLKSDLTQCGKVPVYSSESTNNGIAGNTDIKPDFIVDRENPVYIVFGDHTRSFNVATESFCVMDNVKVLKPKQIYTIQELIYIISSWKKCIPNKGYSRHWSIAKKVKFWLPVSNTGEIDFTFMKSFIIEQESQYINELESYLLVNRLKNYTLTADEQETLNNFENLKWGVFNLEELFGKSTRGKRLKSVDRVEGILPFVTAGEADEGISAYIGNDVEVFLKNTTTIDMFGSAKYRNYNYGGDDHIAVVHTEELTRFSAIFTTAAIHKSSHNGQFNYSRNFYPKDADELNISLPMKNNQPDYAVMEILISAIQKLVIRSVILYMDKKSDIYK